MSTESKEAKLLSRIGYLVGQYESVIAEFEIREDKYKQELAAERAEKATYRAEAEMLKAEKARAQEAREAIEAGIET